MWVRVLSLFCHLQQRIKSYIEVSRQSNNDNPFIHTIARINLQSKRPKITGEDFIRWYREQSQTLTKWAEKKAEDVKKEILAFVDEAYHPLTIYLSCFGCCFRHRLTNFNGNF